MKNSVMFRCLHLACAGAFILSFAGCASLGAGGSRPLTANGARQALAIGTSTKEDVKQALGSAKVNSFASGYEVWVYDYKSGLPALAGLLPVVGTLATVTDAMTHDRELVILFDPAGKVRKFVMREGESKAEALLAKAASQSKAEK